jgi:Protein of unknown function (DUF1097)
VTNKGPRATPSPSMMRSTRMAAAVAAGLVAGASTWGSSKVTGPLLWAAFIGWASYDNNGADHGAVVESSTSMLFGVAMAWCVAIVVAEEWLPWSASISGAVAAGTASVLIVVASAVRLFSRVPAAFYGFASTFAFLTLVPDASDSHQLIHFGWDNGAIAVSSSLLIGTGLGVVHGQLARQLARSRAAESRGSRVRMDGSTLPTASSQHLASSTTD